MPYEPGKYPEAEARAAALIQDLLAQHAHKAHSINQPSPNPQNPSSSITDNDSSQNPKQSGTMDNPDFLENSLLIIPDPLDSGQHPVGPNQHHPLRAALTTTQTPRTPTMDSSTQSAPRALPAASTTPPPPHHLPQPHARLHADIPRLHNRPTHAYIHPPARGADPNDTTALIPGQEWAAPDNLPIGLSQLERALPPENGPLLLRLLRTPRHDARVGALGQPLYDLPILGTRVSSAVEPWRVAMWMCYDARVTVHDVVARMPAVRGFAALREVEERVGRGVVAWCERHCGMAPGRARGASARDAALVGRLCEEQVARNTVWDLVEEGGTGAVFVVQPGGNRFGAMWRAQGRVADARFSKRALEAWVGETTAACGVVEGIEAGWLGGGGVVVRECPPRCDIERFGMHWALSRWHVTMPDGQMEHPPQTSTYRSPYNTSASPDARGYSNPYTSPAVSYNPGIGSPANNGNFQHQLVPSLSSYEPQSSTTTEAQSTINMSDRFSNIHLPPQGQLRPEEAVHQFQSTTSTQGAFNGLPRLVIQPDGRADVENQVVPPLARSTSPYPINRSTVDPERYKQAYAHLSLPELIRAHADALRGPEKNVLMQMVEERRRAEWERERAQS